LYYFRTLYYSLGGHHTMTSTWVEVFLINTHKLPLLLSNLPVGWFTLGVQTWPNTYEQSKTYIRRPFYSFRLSYKPVRDVIWRQQNILNAFNLRWYQYWIILRCNTRACHNSIDYTTWCHYNKYCTYKFSSTYIDFLSDYRVRNRELDLMRVFFYASLRFGVSL